MRLFIAAELPPEIREALAETQAALRASVQGRYVAPDQFHVTLAFLGKADAWRVGNIAAAIEHACAAHVPFEARLADFGSFGRRKAATLWQGFAKNSAFDALANDVRSALTQEGFTFDAKKFLPHVTLMRSASVEDGILPTPAIASGAIDTVTLFASDLSGPRPVYSALHSVKL